MKILTGIKGKGHVKWSKTLTSVIFQHPRCPKTSKAELYLRMTIDVSL